MKRSLILFTTLSALCIPAVQTHAQASKWEGMGVSTGAPLPPAENFKPRPHGAEVAKAGLKAEVIAKLDVEMQRHVAAKNVAGISALIHKDGVRGWFETFGMADIEKGRAMEKDAIFRLMSMTKPVIALAALTLFDEGKFTLDEPISKHCPEWAEPTVKEGGVVMSAKAALTPRMLMSHSSGLGYGGGQAAAAMAYQAMTKPGATLKEFSEAVAKEPLMFQPGTSYNYGMGLDILGRYLEALTGQPLDVILKERLFGPLKMPDPDFHVPAEGRRSLACRPSSVNHASRPRCAGSSPRIEPSCASTKHDASAAIGAPWCASILPGSMGFS
jgi:CubicO group peptidase (beta-lactamase class C family)